MKTPLRGEKGMITVDFLFSIVLILGFAGLMFVMCFTLSLASVTQYITFASARNYFAANITEDQQRLKANQKYAELISNPVFKPLYTNGWFLIDATPFIGDNTQVIPGFQAGAGGGFNKFWGVGTHFTAAVLDMNVPFFGSTAPDSDGSGSQFVTYMGSYLGREPTTQECLEFTNARWNAIRNLSVSGGASYSTNTPSNGGYYPQTDDGC
jgi:hypothetical protein